MEAFFELWIPEKVSQISKYMNQLDKILGIEVGIINTPFYTMKHAKDYLELQIDNDKLRKPPYFLTYSKRNASAFDKIEKYVESGEECYRLSCSKKNNKILGIAVLCDEFGQVLQKWESDEKIEQKTSQDNLDKKNTEEHVFVQDKDKEIEELKEENKDLGKRERDVFYIHVPRKKGEGIWKFRSDSFISIQNGCRQLLSSLL